MSDYEDLLLSDLRKLMDEAWGRRIAHRIIYDFGMLESPTFDRSIKDGLCAALHSARTDGVRATAMTFAQWLQKANDSAYIVMLAEGLRSASETRGEKNGS